MKAGYIYEDNRYTIYLIDSNGGPIVSDGNLGTAKTKFKEALDLMWLVKALDGERTYLKEIEFIQI